MFGRKKRRTAAQRRADVGAAQSAARSADQAARSAAVTAANARPRNLVETLTDPRTARRALTAAKVAGPVLAPLVLKGSTALRTLLDDRRADKLGVEPSEVAAYRGPTGPAAARIDNLSRAVDDLRKRRSTDAAVTRFADANRSRLADLGTAVSAAASMPTGRRRTTLRSIDRDLDGIESELVRRLRAH